MTPILTLKRSPNLLSQLLSFLAALLAKLDFSSLEFCLIDFGRYNMPYNMRRYHVFWENVIIDAELVAIDLKKEIIMNKKE